jgi:hypothetical protein
MPEIISATRTAHGYFVSQLTDHITETPEGFLVVVGCPVARTGWQDYSVKDLPQEAAADMGVDLSNPGASISLYRPAEEVFHPEFLASLNGKPVVDGHPPGFVDPDNFQKYAMGHIQNPRRGPQMDDGEWPIIADLVISSEPLVGKVKNKQAKDISLGYDYGIEKDGDRINQCSMMANHAAVVPKGRAGDLIAIGDEAPEQVLATSAPPADQRAATSQTSTAVQPKKEKKPVPKNIVRHLLGLGLKAFASDAEPEELAEAAEAVNNAPPDAEDSKMKDRKAKDRRAKDNDDPEDGVTEETETQDRQAAHDALDKMIDGLSGKKGKDRKRATDADIEALKDLLGDFLSEEEEEPEHAADISEVPEEQGIDADPSELEEVLGAGEKPDAEDEDDEDGEECPCGEPGCPGCDEADPGEEMEPSGEEALAEDEERSPENDCPKCEGEGYIPGPGGTSKKCPLCKGSGRPAKARDRARAADAHDGARAVLKMLRPFVARAKDESLKTAFNTALGSVSKRSRASDGGGYGAFAGAANDRSRARAKNPGGFRAHAADAAEDANAKMQAVYDQIRTGVKLNTGGK